MKSSLQYILHALAFAGASLAVPKAQVVPGARWTDTDGTPIQAHGAGITEYDGVYYMIGEDKTNGQEFQNVNCYSSTNLVDWQFRGHLLSQTTTAGDLGRDRIIERPKVIYNNHTDTFVMWMHIDNFPEKNNHKSKVNYQEAKVGVATSKEVCGTYTYHGSFRPLGRQSRDLNLFKDDDGTAYLLTEDRDNNLWIGSLTEDYLQVDKLVHRFTNNYESPAMIKKNGYYFIFGSGFNYWDPTDNAYSYSKNLNEGWSDWKTFAAPGSLTHRSQTSFILPFGDSAIYMGDRWHENDLGSSTYIWLPLEFKGTAEKPEVSMPYRDIWALDSASKTWSGFETTVLEPEEASLSKGAKLVWCDGCSQRTGAGYLGGPEGGVATFRGGLGKACGKTAILIVYVNGDQTSRFAWVTVNGERQKVEFPPSRNDQQISNVVIYGKFHSGSDNTIVVEGVDGQWAPNIDKILLARATRR